MNIALIERWNEAVGDDDEVVVLGDFAMGRIAETLPLAALLRGRKVLLAGNHDRCWSGHRKASMPRETGTSPRGLTRSGRARSSST
jgi:calcineurin-like phosphoesterase family protein